MSIAPSEPSRQRLMIALPSDRPGPTSSVPHPLTSLVGREPEVATVCAFLRQPTVRLLTLTGPGGVGKTRLAIEVARELDEDFAGDVVFVPLAPISGSTLVSIVIARALGVQDSGNRPLQDRLHDALRRRRLLLILDNFEHVTQAAPLVGALLAACPRVTALVTSRERLRVAGEHAIPLAPLALPELDQRGNVDLDGLEQSAAIALFVERARAQDPGFALTAENAADVATICRRLDGLPLAIELAAPWSRMLPPAALLSRLERRLSLLTGGARDFPRRHQTLRDAIAWTYDLLAPEEQTVFRRLAVFAGGFTFEAAEAVGGRGGEGGVAALRGKRTTDMAPSFSLPPLPLLPPASPERSDSPSMLALLASLADKHLIYRIGDVGDEPRFGMLETIREFGLEQLAVNEEEAATRAAHAAYYLAMAEANDVPIYNLGRPEALARIEAEHANLRQTLAWLLDNGHGAAARRLTGALFWFWFYRSHLTEGRRWLARALSLPADADEPPAVRARALAGAGALALFQQDLQHAVAPLAEAHRLARDGDDPRALAMVEVLTALLALFQNKLDDVALHAETAANLATPIGDLGSVLRAKFFAALAAHDGGDLQRAAALYEDLLDHTRRAGAMYFQALALQWSARLAQLQAETGLAATRYAEALGIFRDAGELLSVAGCLDGIAAAGSARDGVNAARLIGAGAALRTSIGSPMFPQDRPVHELAISSVTSALGETAFAEAWAAGSQLSLPEALDMAAIVTAAVANGEDSPKSDTVIPGGLTRRELDVLRLLAAGRSDKEIGEALFISHRTAMWHVSNILSKLGASTRAAATSYAVHQGLV